MNIKIANRLLEFRRANGYSQEELAEKLGVSRQAVSKWERAEASPDTDNLIGLAALYGVTIDELINGTAEPTGESSNSGGENAQDNSENDSSDAENDDDDPEITHIGPDGIHVESDGDKVHVCWDGIHVESSDGDRVHIDRNGVFVESSDGEKVNIKDGAINVPRHRWGWIEPMISILAVIAFLVIGFTFERGWAVGWLVFFLIPIVGSIHTAIRKRRASSFAYPVLVAGVYLFLGMMYSMWHPWWIIFITIPLFYIICDAIEPKRHK